MRSTPLLRTRVSFVPVAWVLGALLTSPVRADLLRLNDGRFRAGHIIEEDATRIRFKTGTLSGPVEVTLEKSRIAQTYRTLEEVQQIDQVSDAMQLREWAAAYFHAEVESAAIQCVRRAWKLHPALGERPLEQGSAGFQRFWNRLILRERNSALPERTTASIVVLARWAHDAGLDAETARLIRNAWCQDRSARPIRTLAETWDVDLESWAEADLTEALSVSLLTQAIRDDGRSVPAGAGKHFLNIPIRYDPESGPRVLSKSLFDGMERRAFYGVRVLSGSPQRRPPESWQNGAIYERIELRSGGHEPPQLILKNNLGPRIAQESGPAQERLKARAETTRASGWGVLIFEISTRAKEIRLSWGDGGFDTIDLEYLRSVGRPFLNPKRRDPAGPEIGASLDRLGSGSGATAALAIAQLTGVYPFLETEKREAWAAHVDGKIIAAAARLERAVRDAAWGYFADQETVSPHALRSLRRKNTATKASWIDIIRSHALGGDSHDRAIAMRLLCAILHSRDERICRSALDTLLLLNTEIDWDLVSTASETAQQAALDRIGRLPREEAARMLIALMGSVTLSSADSIARYARSLKLILNDPRDPILKQWSSLKRREDRLALITVLGAVDLGDLIYSRSFDAILRDATRPDADARLRDAAFNTLVEQARRSAQAAPAPAARARGPTAFPILVQMDVTDPVIRTLTEAAATGSRVLLPEALAALLQAGYAEQAEQALHAAAGGAGELNEILEALMAREDIADCNGFLALLGRLMRREHIGSAGRIFAHLSDVVARNPASERWRILAAVKAGVNIKDLNTLVVSLRPSRAVTAGRWLHRLGHLTPQDRRRLAASRDSDARLEQLKRNDLRRAQLVDGRYGVIAVIETTVYQPSLSPPEEDASPLGVARWRAPRRTTLILPTLEIRSNDADDSYRVLWGERPVGRGVAREHPMPIRGPGTFSFRLVNPEPPLAGGEGWGWPVSQQLGLPDDLRDSVALGPAILPGNRPVLEKPTADFMTLELTDYLRAALSESGFINREEAAGFVPDKYVITLRYAAFASYSGVGVRRPPPWNQPEPGRRHLLNLMLVLERID